MDPAESMISILSEAVNHSSLSPTNDSSSSPSSVSMSPIDETSERDESWVNNAGLLVMVSARLLLITSSSGDDRVFGRATIISEDFERSVVVLAGEEFADLQRSSNVVGIAVEDCD